MKPTVTKLLKPNLLGTLSYFGWCPVRKFSRKKLAPLLLTSVLITSTACAPVVHINSAVDATNSLCAEIMVRLPDALPAGSASAGENSFAAGSLQRRDTDSQSTAAWGDPVAVTLKCGMEPPAPSTLPCFDVDGIHWLAVEGDPTYTFLSYGRAPATQVVVDTTQANSRNVLSAFADALSQITATRLCS